MIVEWERVVPSAHPFGRIERQGVDMQLSGERAEFGDICFRGACRQIDAADPSEQHAVARLRDAGGAHGHHGSPSSAWTGVGTPIAVSVVRAFSQLSSASISASERRFGRFTRRTKVRPASASTRYTALNSFVIDGAAGLEGRSARAPLPPRRGASAPCPHS